MNSEPKKYKPFGWHFWLLLIGSIAILYAFARPPLDGCTKKADRTEAVSNLKQIGLALHEFQNQYGVLPNDQTAALVLEKHPSDYNLSGTSSNFLFRQLLAAEITPSEEIFYAKTRTSKKPDGNITPGEALNKGEVGFAYISGLNLAENSSTPLVLSPLIPGTTKFDPVPFDGHAIVLKNDQSVTAYKIRKDGSIYDKGINILSPEHPIWIGKAPDIRYPE